MLASWTDSQSITLLIQQVAPPNLNPGIQAMCSGGDSLAEGQLYISSEEAIGSGDGSSVPDAGGKAESPVLATLDE